jgi:NAD dependent epimerase/dehydratase family enzyme
MGQALLLDGARVLPRRLESAGFQFQHPQVDSALRAALGQG